MLNPEVKKTFEVTFKLRTEKKLRIDVKAEKSWELESDRWSIGVENRCQESLIEPGGPLVVSAQVVRGGDTQLRLVWGQYGD